MNFSNVALLINNNNSCVVRFSNNSYELILLSKITLTNQSNKLMTFILHKV